MSFPRVHILRHLARLLLLALGCLILPASTASAQYPGYGGYGYGGIGYGGYGYGGIGYGYGAVGYGGYGGYGGGLGFNGYGYGYPGYNSVFGVAGSSYVGTGLAGVGYPGIGYQNPYFSAGLSPLAVETAIFERTILGRTSPTVNRAVRGSEVIAIRPATSMRGPVGTGTFAAPR